MGLELYSLVIVVNQAELLPENMKPASQICKIGDSKPRPKFCPRLTSDNQLLHPRLEPVIFLEAGPNLKTSQLPSIGSITHCF